MRREERKDACHARWDIGIIAFEFIGILCALSSIRNTPRLQQNSAYSYTAPRGARDLPYTPTRCGTVIAAFHAPRISDVTQIVKKMRWAHSPLLRAERVLPAPDKLAYRKISHSLRMNRAYGRHFHTVLLEKNNNK